MNRAEIQNVVQQENAKEFEHLEHRPQQEVGMMKAGEAEEAPEVRIRCFLCFSSLNDSNSRGGCVGGKRAVSNDFFVSCRLPRMNLVASRHFSPDHPFKHSLWNFLVYTTIMWKSSRALLLPPLVYVYVHVDDMNLFLFLMMLMIVFFNKSINLASS
jgi:hypothetical protein